MSQVKCCIKQVASGFHCLCFHVVQIVLFCPLCLHLSQLAQLLKHVVGCLWQVPSASTLDIPVLWLGSFFSEVHEDVPRYTGIQQISCNLHHASQPGHKPCSNVMNPEGEHVGL